MIVRLNGFEFPSEMPTEIEPIQIAVSVGDGNGWKSQITMTLDSGANTATFSRSTWVKLFGSLPSKPTPASAEMADGRDVAILMTEVSLRIETTDHDLVEIHRLPCAIVEGDSQLLPLTVLSLFKVTVTKGKMTELIFSPQRKIELARLGE